MDFQLFHSVVEPGFWTVFSKAKLERLKLDERPINLHGWYGQARSERTVPLLRVSGNDLNFDDDNTELNVKYSKLLLPARGILVNKNSVEDFKALDKSLLMESQLELLRDKITDSSFEEDSSQLVPFVIVSYADLKYHRFLYWFCFPAIHDPRFSKYERISIEQTGIDSEGLEQIMQSQPPGNIYGGFFGVLKGRRMVSLKELLNEARNGSLEDSLSCLGFVDPGNSNAPGWPLLNFMHWAIEKLFFDVKLATVPVLCVRRQRESTIAIRAYFDYTEVYQSGGSKLGWEPNAKGRMGPRLIDLSEQLDPEKLSQSACDLNLKLMAWRAFPKLDVELISGTRCLLIGAGTLGCAVSRSLLGWGFRKITFVDNGFVSYSNPVRQSLFVFKDCIGGKAHKAMVAADALRNIQPQVEATGVNLSIPMPGHFVGSNQDAITETKNSCCLLDDLIAKHDVVMLLTDTRESRWLPTLLASKRNKMVLTSALGFESFLVMRHGFGPDEISEGSQRLSCYFCNDLVAPTNSMLDRTLDQQCTVTRPGLAPIAGALLVELLVGLIHHPMGHCAPVIDQSVETAQSNAFVENEDESGFGNLPHQIRGSLSSFRNMCVSGLAFPQCTACSQCVVNEYKERGFDMLLEAFNSPSYLEDLSGLTALHQKTEASMSLWEEFDSSEDED